MGVFLVIFVREEGRTNRRNMYPPTLRTRLALTRGTVCTTCSLLFSAIHPVLLLLVVLNTGWDGRRTERYLAGDEVGPLGRSSLCFHDAGEGHLSQEPLSQE